MKNDNGSERLRLAEHYAGMSDDELLSLARDLNALTEAARAAMTAELQKRGIQPELVPLELVETEPPSDRPLVTVGRYLLQPEVLLAKAALDAGGIASFIADETMNRIYLPTVTGGARLEVAAEDAEHALQILNAPMPAEFEIEGVGVYHQPVCPQCGSLDLSYAKSEPDDLQDGWQCDECGYEWPVEQEDVI